MGNLDTDKGKPGLCRVPGFCKWPVMDHEHFVATPAWPPWPYEQKEFCKGWGVSAPVWVGEFQEREWDLSF